MTFHPGRMMETSERQPFVVGVVMVVMVVMVVSESFHVLPSKKKEIYNNKFNFFLKHCNVI